MKQYGTTPKVSSFKTTSTTTMRTTNLAIAPNFLAQKDMIFIVSSSIVSTLSMEHLYKKDFHGNPEEGRTIVNDWVSEQTLSNIPELLPEGVVTSNTRLILTNAIYLNAPWKQPFDPSDTRDFPYNRGWSNNTSTHYDS